MGNDTQGSTIEVDVSPTRSIATLSAPQDSAESSEPTTLVHARPSDSELPTPYPPNTPAIPPMMTLPNSTGPPALGEEQGKGKRKGGTRRDTMRLWKMAF